MRYVKTRADFLEQAKRRVAKREKATGYSGLFGQFRDNRPYLYDPSEVKQLMNVLRRLSIYTYFRVACAYHKIGMKVGMDEAINDWLKKHNMKDNLPRWYEAAEEKREEQKEARRLKRQEKI